ncbi:histidinol-phosphate aminotransferase family protein [Bradyrhizobium sp. CNPSo 4026]|nr:histidinol-phosphate aminotransferase family protein [Bradyrhizobium cenepequi]
MSTTRGGAVDGIDHPPVRLSLNENPFGPSQSALVAIRNQFGEFCRYVDETADMLTPAIVTRENISADHIVLGEILESLGIYLAKNGPSGGEFIYSEPGYTALVDAVARCGGIVTGVPLNQNLENDLNAIANRVDRRTQAVYLINPHSPTGTVSDTAAFRNFVREISKRTTVIVDEAYLEFEPDFAERTVVDLTRAGENVVVFRTFGKIYSLAGLSVGYAVAPRDLAGALKRAKIGTPDVLTRPALAAAAASLEDEHYIEAVRKRVVIERGKWNELFQSMNLRHSDSRGNFVFFESGKPLQELSAALRARGIDIGPAFPPLDRWARISIGLPNENAMARRAIAELLQ